MDKYTLTAKQKKQVEQVLLDNGIDLSTVNPYSISEKLNIEFHEDNLWEYIERLDNILNTSANYPLFASRNEQENAIAFAQNYLVIKSFITEAKKEIENSEDIMLSSSEHDDIRLIKNGEYVIRILKEKFLSICHLKYGFTDAFSMAYLIGAYVANWAQFKDKREVFCQTDDMIYVYDNFIHGDFRLSQYDCSIKTLLDPIDKNITFPFGVPKHMGTLSGYHSVETYFLTNLLGCLHFTNTSCDTVINFNDFIADLKSEGQIYGAYADAGAYDAFAVTLGFGKFQQKKLEPICTAGDDIYQPAIESDHLVIYHNKDDQNNPNSIAMKIHASHINCLIIGLFNKVAKGNGRSSIFALEDTMNFYRVKYCDVPLELIKFNKDLSELCFS
jgi:hypothetical protein